MSEEQQAQSQQTEQSEQTATEPHGSNAPHGEETDWKAEARKWETRAKENSEKAKRFDEIEEANKTELEKAQARAQKAESELKAIKDAQAREENAKQVSKDTGVPVELIKGDTLEEMKAFAKEHAHYFEKKAVPVINSDGKSPQVIGNDTDFIRELFNK